LVLAVLAVAIIAALSGVWMKPEPKKDKDGGRVPNITVIVPPAARSDPLAPPPTIPDAKRYPL
jgi:hypothetical protein